MPSRNTSQTFTYQTRVQLSEAASEMLANSAELLSAVERNLFKEFASGQNLADLKSEYLKKYKITARHYNALRIQLEGKIASIREAQKGQIFHIKEKIASTKKRITKLEKRDPSNKLHQLKRLLENREAKLKRLEMDQASGKVALCFGSKQLFKAQFNLESNGYASHEEWRSEWQNARSNSFFLLGSKDESSGNQSCTATLATDGTLTLRIRLPDCLATDGKYLLIPHVHFEYGHQEIIQALKSCEERKHLQLLKNPQFSHYGSPISYRFKCDAKGWRIFVTIPVEKAPLKTSSKQGVIGVDINAQHLAVTETDRFGNPLTKKTILLNTYGKNRNQANALIGDACAKLIDSAEQTGKSLVIEELDFQKKKASLKGQDPAHARMLSSLSYNKIKSGLKSRAGKKGVEITEVNPAYTSLIGQVKFAKRYGLSIHHSAALVIGRRCLGASERVPRHLDKIPDGKRGHVAFSLPVRNREKHVWSTWRTLGQKLRTVLAAHFRAIRRSSSSKPTLEINSIPKFAGATPVRESSEALLV